MADGKVVIDSEYDGKNAEKGFKDFQSKMDKTSKSVQKVGKGMTAALTAPILAVGAAMAGAAVKAGNWADELLDLEAMTGASTATMQVWRKMAATAGVDTNTMATATQKLNRFLSDAEEISPKVENSIKKLGYGVAEFVNMKPEDRMRALAQAMGEMDEKSRIDIANNFRVVDILPVISQFGDGIEASTQSMLDQGKYIDKDGLNTFNNFRIAIADTKEEFMLLIGNALLPMVSTMNTTLIPMLKEHLIPVFEMLIGWIKMAFDWFANLDINQQKLILTIIAVVAAIGPLLMIGAQLIALFGFIISPVGLVILSIGLLIAAFIYLWNTSEEFRDRVTKVFNFVKEMIMVTISAIKEFVMSQLDLILKFWDDHGAMIMEAVKVAFEFIMSVIEFVMPFILMLIESIWKNIKGVISGALQVIMGLVRTFAALITGNWKEVWEGIKQTLSGLLTLIWNLVQLAFVGKIIGILRSFGKQGLTIIKRSFEDILSFIKALGTRFKDAGRGLIDQIVKGITGAIGRVKDAIGNVTSMIRDFLPFSPAKDGPLKDLDKLDFGGVIETSILKDIPKVEMALGKMLKIPSFSKEKAITSETEEPNNKYKGIEKEKSQVVVNFNDIVVADKQGLRRLERLLRSIRIDEDKRLGVDTE